MPQFFIDRPVFAWVVALFILLAGALAIPQLPVAQYPNVAPPQVEIYAVYPGASAADHGRKRGEPDRAGTQRRRPTCCTSSPRAAWAAATITATFAAGDQPGPGPGRCAEPPEGGWSRACREPVTQQGLHVENASTGFLLLVHPHLRATASSTKPRRSDDYLARNVMNEIRRLKGVGKAQLYGSGAGACGSDRPAAS